jgi:hypothetical protein
VRPAFDLALRVRRCDVRPGAGRGMQSAQWPGPVDTHHDVARFSWGLGGDGDDPLVIGSDVASVGADGRLARVVGFLDKVPT